MMLEEECDDYSNEDERLEYEASDLGIPVAEYSMMYYRYQGFYMLLAKRGFQNHDTGGFRRVWIRQGIVVKVPVCLDGILDNRAEAGAWKKYGNKPTDLGIYLAPC